jgi:GAF domain-containing protein
MSHTPPPDESEHWFGAQEAARFVGIHRSTLHAAVRQGVIVPDGRTPGGHVRFREQTLLAFRHQLAEGSATSSGVFAPMHVLADLAHLLAVPEDFACLSAAAIDGIRSALSGVDICAVAVRAGDPHDPVRLRAVARHGFPDWVFDSYARLHKTFKFSTTVALVYGEMEVRSDTSQGTMHTGTARICRALGIGAYAIVPIGAEPDAPGVIICACHRPRDFSDHDRAFLRGIADQLAAALKADSQRDQLTANLDAARELIATALAIRGRASTVDGEPRTLAERARIDLRDVFMRHSGAEHVCALGFHADLPVADLHLLEMACKACGSNEPVWDQWREGGVLHTGVGASVPLRTGTRGGVAAAWLGERPQIEADHTLLTAFAGAYVLALGLQ